MTLSTAYVPKWTGRWPGVRPKSADLASKDSTKCRMRSMPSIWPWMMSEINGGNTQITIPNMDSAGVADGTYSIINTSPWFTENVWLQPPQSLYFYQLGNIGNGSSYPSGYLQQMIKNGPGFNTADNRFNKCPFCWGKTASPFAANTGSLEWGNYFAMQPSGQTNHGYQSLNVNTFAKPMRIVCLHFELPAFRRWKYSGISSGPADFGRVGPSYPNWTGEAGHNFYGH